MTPLQIWRPLLPLVVSYVPLAIRRALAPYVPIPAWGKMLSIIQAMDTQSKNVFYGKKQALEKGDEALKQQIGEGRDIMSIHSKSSRIEKNFRWCLLCGSESEHAGVR